MFPCVRFSYDEQKPHNYIIYRNCTNLYGTAMTQPLHIPGFRWLDRNDIDALDVNALRDDDENGYILEADLTYPQHLHDLHSNYPLAPETPTITDDMLSPYCMRMRMLKGFTRSTVKVKKVITLDDGRRYIIHYRMLKYNLELGMELKGVHLVLAFSQCAWLKPFIDFNTAKQKAAKSFIVTTVCIDSAAVPTQRCTTTT